MHYGLAGDTRQDMCEVRGEETREELPEHHQRPGLLELRGDAWQWGAAAQSAGAVAARRSHFLLRDFLYL